VHVDKTHSGIKHAPLVAVLHHVLPWGRACLLFLPLLVIHTAEVCVCVAIDALGG